MSICAQSPETGFSTSIICRACQRYRIMRPLAAIEAIVVTGCLLSLGPQPASAAAAAAVHSDSGSAETSLQEVIVTARKRRESLEETPIAITALTAEGLVAHHIVAVDQVAQFTPNMTFVNTASFSGSTSAASVFIRGVGQTDFNQNTEPGVGIYVDGVYLARSVGSAFDLLDIDRIEVLRGPQGTLFGQNTIGGAIQIITKKPTGTSESYIDVTTGTTDRLDMKAGISGPLGENVFGRISVLSMSQDGYIKRVDAPNHDLLGNVDTLAARARIIWNATDAFSVDVIADVSRDNTNGSPTVAVAIDGTSVPFAGYYNADLLNSVNPANDCGVRTANAPPGAPPFLGAFAITNPAAYSNPQCYNSQYVLGPHFNAGTGQNLSDTSVAGISTTLDWDLILGMKLKSISAYRNLDSIFALDQDVSPLVIDQTFDDYRQHQVSQEFQLTGTAFQRRAHWLLGADYFHEVGTDTNIVDFSIGTVLSGGDIYNSSYAVFGQSTFELVGPLELTVGVRYTTEEKKFRPVQYYLSGPPVGATPGFPPGVPIIASSGQYAKLAISQANELGTLTYHWSDALMTYLSYSNGFKSGGFTQRNSIPLENVPSFQPEFVHVFELGTKYQLSNEFRVNVAAFTNRYTNIQVGVVSPITAAPQTSNAAAAKIDGAELELTFAADRWLLEASGGWLDARYSSIGSAAVAAQLSTSDLLPYAPKWTGSFGVSYEQPLSNGATLRPRLDLSYKSRFATESINNPLTTQGAFTLIDLSLTYASRDDRWSVTAMGLNLSNRQYILSGFTSPVGAITNNIARGREWALEAHRKF